MPDETVNMDPALAEVQGNILKGFDKPNVRLIFFKFGTDNQKETFDWLSDLSFRVPNTTKLIKSSERLDKKRHIDPSYQPQEIYIHVSLSFAGIRYLQLPVPHSTGMYKGRGKSQAPVDPEKFSLDAVPQAQADDPFYIGMKFNAKSLGDTRDSAPEKWDEPYKLKKDKDGNDISTEIDALLIVAADEEDDLDIYASKLISEATLRGNTCVGLEIGKAILNEQGKQVEHFGFRDGISQPLIRGVSKESRNDNPDLFDPEDFVLFGIKDKKGEKRSWANYGSFLVFRKLEQHVPEFWKDMSEISKSMNMAPEHIAAKFVGRWKSGAPLSSNPDHDPVSPDYSDNNDFLYREKIVSTTNGGSVKIDDDSIGKKTPKFAHIRVANPRDDSGIGGLDTPANNIQENDKHRILRHGIPYGPQWAKDPLKGKILKDKKDKKAERPNHRGLLFICYQRDLAEQFEYIQRHWWKPNQYKYEGEDAEILKKAEPPTAYEKVGLERWVTTKGGDYFFSPSISALRKLRKYSKWKKETRQP